MVALVNKVSNKFLCIMSGGVDKVAYFDDDIAASLFAHNAGVAEEIELVDVELSQIAPCIHLTYREIKHKKKFLH